MKNRENPTAHIMFYGKPLRFYPQNKSLSKYNANVSAKAKEFIDYYFNLANIDFVYAENQYEKDMELSKIYEEAMKD